VGAALKHLQIVLDCPATLSLSLAAPTGATANGLRCTLPELHAGGSTSLCARAACVSAAGGAEQHLLGQVAYTEVTQTG